MFSSPARALWVILPVIVLSAGLVYWLVIRPWLLTWGATDADVRRSLAGDDLVPQPKMETTHAITMQASAANPLCSVSTACQLSPMHYAPTVVS